MKILFLDQYGDLGGAQRCLLDLLPEISARKWLSIVAAPEGPMLGAARHYATVARLRLPAMRSTRKALGDWIRFARDTPSLASSINEVIEEHRPEVLYVNGPRLVPALALANPGLPCVFHSHHFLTQAGVRRAVRLGLQRLHAMVIANCHYVAAQWPGVPVSVIYNGVAGGSYRDPGPLLRIGVVGRIAKEKGQAIFLEAAGSLAHRKDLAWLLIGVPLFEDEAAAEYLRELQRAAPPTVQFTGWLESPLDRVDLLIVPSTGAEATTRVIPEAWAAGVPVIASRVGGIGEIVEDNRTGFLAEPNSSRALAACVERVLAMPVEEVRALTRAARQTYEQQFTRERYAGDVAGLLARLAASETPD